MRITPRSLPLLLTLSVLGVTGCNDSDNSERNLTIPISVQASANGAPLPVAVRTSPAQAPDAPALPGGAVPEGLDPNLLPAGGPPDENWDQAGADGAQPLPALEENAGRPLVDPAGDPGARTELPVEVAGGPGAPAETSGSAPVPGLDERSQRATGMSFGELMARQNGASEAQRRLQAQRVLELAERNAG